MEFKIEKKTLNFLIVFVLIVGSFYLGKTDFLSNGFSLYRHPTTPELMISDEDFSPFWKAWQTINDKLVTATSTNSKDRVWGAIEGMVKASGDPYTVFFPPVESKAFAEEISGTFSGVGMEVGQKDGIITVISPLKDSPAQKAGILSGDKILQIAGVSTVDMSVDKAVSLIRGESGTDVKIIFARSGDDKPVEKTITRAVINIPTVETELIGDKNVFVIKLFSFTAQAHTLFKDALREFVESGSRDLVIDLRNNPGGYLSGSIDIASWFLPPGAVVVTEDFGGKDKPKVYRSRGYDILGKFKFDIAVLVNGGSASASEILAGALKENGVATIVGEKTFGKGSVQELVPITSDTSLKVTVARWLTPSGHNISLEGLEPDIKVIDSKSIAKSISTSTDPVLDKAIEILTK